MVRRVPLVKTFFRILATKARGAVVERAGLREKQIHGEKKLGINARAFVTLK